MTNLTGYPPHDPDPATERDFCLKEKTMTTYFTTYIDLPATLNDIEALLERLSDVDSNEAFIGVVESRDGDRLEVSYSSDDLIKKRTSTGPHLHFSAHVYASSEEEFAERMAEHKKRAERFPFTGVDVEDGKGTPVTTKIEQQRDHLGRFTKRK